MLLAGYVIGFQVLLYSYFVRFIICTYFVCFIILAGVNLHFHYTAHVCLDKLMLS